MSIHPNLALPVCGLALGLMTACGSQGSAAAATHEVRAGDRSCTVDETALDAGRHAFRIENVGTNVTEVYVYGKDGDDFTKVMAERENIGPGTSQTLEVDLAAGDYQVACKPGMTGDGIRAGLTVTGPGGAVDASDEGYDRELELVVDRTGQVRAPAKLTGTVDEVLELKLRNESQRVYELELVAPDGTEIGEGRAGARRDVELVRRMTVRGDYQVTVLQPRHENDATTFALTVTR